MISSILPNYRVFFVKNATCSCLPKNWKWNYRNQHFDDGSSEISDKIGMIQRRSAWPLRKDDTHKLRIFFTIEYWKVEIFLCILKQESFILINDCSCYYIRKLSELNVLFTCYLILISQTCFPSMISNSEQKAINLTFQLIGGCQNHRNWFTPFILRSACWRWLLALALLVPRSLLLISVMSKKKYAFFLEIFVTFHVPNYGECE